MLGYLHYGGTGSGFTSFNIDLEIISSMALIDVEIEDTRIEVVVGDDIEVIVDDKDIEVEIS